MNAPTRAAEAAQLAGAEEAPSYALAPSANTSALILAGDALDRMERFANRMASGAVTVPRHLQGNVGDCLAITLQAMQWNMNPFAVAQKTHISQGGALGYEGQLVGAVLVSTGTIKRSLDFEFLGNWHKVLGKVEERKSDKGGKYYVATYTKGDEEGLGVVVRGTLRGEQNARELTLMLSQCYPRFSTQWATDPMQQICYIAERKWARRYAPGAILGVYFNDELDDGAEPKFMGPADVVQQPASPACYPQEAFDKNLPAWRKAIESGKKSVDDVIATVETKAPLTDAQKAMLREIKAPAVTDVQPKGDAPAVSYAQVADKLHAAQDTEQLAAAAAFIAAVADEAQRKELTALYEQRTAELPF